MRRHTNPCGMVACTTAGCSHTSAMCTGVGSHCPPVTVSAAGVGRPWPSGAVLLAGLTAVLACLTTAGVTVLKRMGVPAASEAVTLLCGWRRQAGGRCPSLPNRPAREAAALLRTCHAGSRNVQRLARAY